MFKQQNNYSTYTLCHPNYTHTLHIYVCVHAYVLSCIVQIEQVVHRRQKCNSSIRKIAQNFRQNSILSLAIKLKERFRGRQRSDEGKSFIVFTYCFYFLFYLYYYCEFYMRASCVFVWECMRVVSWCVWWITMYPVGKRGHNFK